MTSELWVLVLCCLAYYLAAGVAITFGYHRLLTHRSFRLPLWLERAVVCLGLPAGTPIQWVGNHRQHHASEDREGDPHSPHLDGFWYAHVGWYLGTHNRPLCFLYSLAGPLRMLFDGWHRPRTNQASVGLAQDVTRDPFYAFVSRPLPYQAACTLHALVPLALAYLGWGWVGVAAFWLTLVVVYNLGDCIDSVAHLWGSRPYPNASQARNNWVLGLLTMGEGWHANHHAFPASARHGLLPYQPDGTWLAIRLLRGLGIAKQVVVPSPEQLERRLQPERALSGDGSPA